MKLSRLISSIETVGVTNFRECELTDVFSDSREKFKNSLFIAVKGLTSDGAEYADDAVRSGACAVIYETAIEKMHDGVTYIKVRDSRAVQSRAAGLVYGEPAKKLRLTGITGTNGKTSTAYILRHILNSNGYKCGLIGTTEYDLGGRRFTPSRTTPDAVFLQRYFRDMADSGLNSAVMEVSSHALILNRVEDIRFDCAVFTNLTQDHLDFHGTMEDYAVAKSALFTKYLKPEGIAVINTDDAYCGKICGQFGGTRLTYSVSGEKADLSVTDIKHDMNGMRISVIYRSEPYEITTGLTGGFQAYNIAAAFLAAVSAGVPEKDIVRSVGGRIQIPGRLEKVYSGAYDVYIDYAHTPDALSRTLSAVREFGRNRVLTVMGCGGNRDREKRPVMGGIASSFSDMVIVTNDNPRYEDPASIINEITKGMKGGNYSVVQDRREAISAAVSAAREGDVVVIAGKGHEDYQEINGVKYPFSDKETVHQLTGGTDG